MSPAVPSLLLAAFATVVGAVEFTPQPLPDHSIIRLSATSRLSFTGAKPPSVSSHFDRETFILETANGAPRRVKVVYGEAAVTSNLPGIPSRTLAVSGRTYLLRSQGSDLEIATPIKGQEIDAEEQRLIGWDFNELGAIHPVAVMLQGQSLVSGNTPKSLDVLKALLEEKFAPYGIAEITTLTARVDSTGRFGSDNIMRIDLHVESGASSLYPELSFKLDGELVVATPSGRPLGIQLAGPVEMTLPSEVVGSDGSVSTTPGKRRGRFVITFESATTKGPEKIPEYDRDWDYRAGGPWLIVPRRHLRR